LVDFKISFGKFKAVQSYILVSTQNLKIDFFLLYTPLKCVITYRHQRFPIIPWKT